MLPDTGNGDSSETRAQPSEQPLHESQPAGREYEERIRAAAVNSNPAVLNALLLRLGGLANQATSSPNSTANIQSNPLSVVAMLLVSLQAASQAQQNIDEQTQTNQANSALLAIPSVQQQLSIQEYLASQESAQTQPQLNRMTAAGLSAPAAAVNSISIATPHASAMHKSKKVPCRARGLPPDHNAETAYFVIENDTSHGEDLLCSHIACRGRGMKFRYCAFCGVPVARRNFRRRHEHSGTIFPSGHKLHGKCNAGQVSSNFFEGVLRGEFPSCQPAGSEQLPSSENSASNQALMKPPPVPRAAAIARKLPLDRNVPSESARRPEAGKRYQHNENVKAGTEARSSSLSGSNRPVRWPDNIGIRGSKKSSFRQRQLDGDGDEDSLTDPQPAQVSVDEGASLHSDDLRQLEWTSLLDERPPSDDDEMSSWLRRVLAVSDLDSPYPPRARSQKQKLPNHASSLSSATDEDNDSTPTDNGPDHSGDSASEFSSDESEKMTRTSGSLEWRNSKIPPRKRKLVIKHENKRKRPKQPYVSSKRVADNGGLKRSSNRRHH